MRCTVRSAALLLLLCLPVFVSHGQSLAHPGWRGNGFAAEAWWKHATFVRFGPEATFAEAAAGIDAMSQVGADSLILPDLRAPAPTTAAATVTAAPFDSRFGTEDDLDTLLREVSARRMHVLIRVPLARLVANAGEVRFWMSRGISGFDVGDVTPADAGTLRALNSSLGQFPGRRVILAHLAQVSGSPARAAGSVSPRDAVTIPIDTADEVEAGSSAAEPEGARAVEVSAFGSTAAGDAASLPHLLPLLLTGDLVILDRRLLASESAREQVRLVLALRTSQPVLRSVRATPLAVTGLRAWLLRDRGAAHPPLLLVWNTSAAAVSLEAAVTQAHVPAGYIVPLLRSDGHAGPLKVGVDSLPPGAVVLGSFFGQRSLPRRGKR